MTKQQNLTRHISFDLEFRKNPYKGKIVVVEGTDGAGKTTQAKALVKKLNLSNIPASYTKEPTDDIIGQFIREKVLSGEFVINPLALQYLFNADRIMHMEKIEKLLQKGMVIVMDRYFWSAIAYAMADMEAIPDWSMVAFSILSFYHQSFAPDYTFLLEISPEEAMKRIQASGKHKEIYDTKEKLLKTTKAYEYLKKEFPDMITIVSGDRSQEEITEELFNKVKESIKY